MACNCNRPDCTAETNARGRCPFWRPRRVLDPSMLVSVTDEEYARASTNSGQTHEGQGMAWGPFDPN